MDQFLNNMLVAVSAAGLAIIVCNAYRDEKLSSLFLVHKPLSVQSYKSFTARYQISAPHLGS